MRLAFLSFAPSKRKKRWAYNVLRVKKLFMPRNGLKQNSKPGNVDAAAALKEKTFCVALNPDGTTVKMEAENINEFKKIVDGAVVSWIDYIVDDLKKEAVSAATSLGFSELLVSILIKNKRSGYEDFNTEMGMVLPAILVNGFNVTVDPLLMLIKENVVLTIHSKEVKRFFRVRRYAETFMKKIKPNIRRQDKITMVLIRILDENNSRNFDHLREIEENADKLTERLVDLDTPRELIGPEIHKMKHALITYLGALWENVDVLNTLRYGDPEILTDDPKLLERLEVLVTEVNNHIGLAEHLSEVLASGLEVLQSIYNNQLQILNNKMALLVAYLTILGTAVLVPNTLATALSNPAYNLGPQDAWWFTALMAVSTIASTLIAYWWVKKKGLLPSKAQ